MRELESASPVATVDVEPVATPAAGTSPADPAGRRQRSPLTVAERRWLIGILAVSAIVRSAWLTYAHVEPPVWYIPSGDSFSYWYYGNEIAHGRGYISYLTGDATAYYPIGFPAILGGLYWLANHVPFVDPDLMIVTGVFQVVIQMGTVGLTFVIGRRLIGPRAGLVAAAVLAFFPNLIYQVTTIQVETTFIFFTLAALAIVVDHDWSTGPPSRNRLLVFGAVLSASALVRPFSSPLLLGLLLALLAVGVGWRRAVLAVAIPLGVLVVAFTPWTIRNAVALDAFVPSSTNMGDTLCIDRGPGAYGGFRWSTHPGCADPDLPEAERNTASTRKAIQFVVDDPGRELLQVVRRAGLMFGDDHDGIIATEGLGSGPILSDTSRDFYVTVADWYFYVVLALSVVGFPLLIARAPRPERRLVLVILVALLVIPLLLWGNTRFHQPLVPLMAVSMGALVVAVIDRRPVVASTTQPRPGASRADEPESSPSPAETGR
jgi:Dolichyl-phosphate-mannose-protein mannosyltransferase